jgi:hypothetical protein
VKPDRSQVWVQCIRASHLRDDRFGGLIDRAHPFCRFALAGTSFETLVVDNAANPEWNEEFLFSVPPHPTPLCSLLSTERHSMPTLSCSAPTATFPALSS